MKIAEVKTNERKFMNISNHNVITKNILDLHTQMVSSTKIVIIMRWITAWVYFVIVNSNVVCTEIMLFRNSINNLGWWVSNKHEV